MGNFSPWHGLFLLMMVAVPAAMIVGLVWLVRRTGRSRNATAPIDRRHPAASGHSLQDLDAQLASGAIGADEYERRRAAIATA